MEWLKQQLYYPIRDMNKRQMISQVVNLGKQADRGAAEAPHKHESARLRDLYRSRPTLAAGH